MQRLPSGFAWLYNEPAPLMLKKAIETYGTIEFPGIKSNPIIMGWAEECGLKSAYSNDEIPWCGLAVAVWAKRATWNLPNNPLWARDWLNWGTHAPVPMLCDVMIFARGNGGHVGLYVGETSTQWLILGGNQSNSVNIAAKPKRTTGDGRLLGVRRAPWRIAQPSNVRRIILKSTNGALAGTEA